MTFRQVLLYQTKLTYSNILICISILFYCTFFPILAVSLYIMVEFLRLQRLIEKPAKKKVFICVPFSSVFALSDVDFCYDCSWKKNVVGAASDNFIYDLEKTSFSFEYYYSKSSHSIEGRFQVA